MRWKAVVGYEGFYEVDKSGQVKSLARTVVTKTTTRKYRSRLMSKCVCHGYEIVHLRKHGTSVTKAVHRLVAEAFVPNPRGRSEVNHKDGDKANNHADNLEWSTRSENMIHAMNVLGRRWDFSGMGKLGGVARAMKLTPQQKSEIGSKGARAVFESMTKEEWRARCARAGKKGGVVRAATGKRGYHGRFTSDK